METIWSKSLTTDIVQMWGNTPNQLLAIETQKDNDDGDDEERMETMTTFDPAAF